MLYKITLRNILRNRRRSAMAVLALTIGALSLLLFGSFMAAMILGLKTSAIANNGHLTVYRSGYLDYGSGNPGPYSIGRAAQVMALIRSDAVLKPLLTVVTPRVAVYGIAGNFELDRSKTFFGVGFVPSDRVRMLDWDEYRIRVGRPAEIQSMSDADMTRGIIGVGLARILGLCESLHLEQCPAAPRDDATAASQPAALAASQPIAPTPKRDFSALAQPDVVLDGQGTRSGPAARGAPSIDLLAATTSGAPNVVSLNVGGTGEQAVKELDDNYVGMPLALAQQLLFGRGEHKVTSIVLQLRHTADMASARARLAVLFKDNHLDLEAHDFIELTPMYQQVIALFGAIFCFIALILGTIVLFAVTNTMSMTVVERTNEIGTIRAMGVRRGGIWNQFFVEGSMLGVLGASSGVVLAALLPARRAARMPVVDALRHV
jgi:putative ABC transport system permease protein